MEKTSIPEWNDIRFITNDLQNVLDNFEDDQSPIPSMRARLARAIAEMRDEKGLEEMTRKEYSQAIIDPYQAIREMTAQVRARLREVMCRK